MRILVADDDDGFRKALDRHLYALGHTTEMVENGDELLNMLEHEQYDVVITDFNMPPGPNGLEVLRRIRYNSGHKRIPVIVFTTTEEIQKRVEKLGGKCADKMHVGGLTAILERL